jgi:hypothetical protein
MSTFLRYDGGALDGRSDATDENELDIPQRSQDRLEIEGHLPGFSGP